MYSLWQHLSLCSAFLKIYLIVARGLFALNTTLFSSRLFLRNVTWGRAYANTKIIQVRDSVRLQVTVPRPWKVRAGEYVFIWLPEVNLWSPFQSHPFIVTWWNNDIDGKATNVYLLVKPENGVSRKVGRHAGACALRSWIDGPYGQTKDVGNFGSVLMFASGIGIAAQIPYLKELIRGYKECTVRTKRILLVWQLDKESKMTYFLSGE